MIQHSENEVGICFHLSSDFLSCLLRIRHGKLELVHFGRPVSSEDISALSLPEGLGWGCSILYRQEDPSSSLDARALAWSESGTGDFRESPISIRQDGLNLSPDFIYESYEILEEKPLSGSAVPQAKGKCETLKLNFVSDSSVLSRKTGCSLFFSLYDGVLVRRTSFHNGSAKPVQVTRIMSSLMDLKGRFRMTTFDGSWITEVHRHDVPVSRSRSVNESLSGFSSNRSNPGFLLSRPDTTEDSGEAYGFNLIWSGNHYGSAQLSEQGLTRVLQGVSPDSFCREIPAGEGFDTPEAVIAYSSEGFNGLSECMHRFVNRHIIPEYWQFRDRPVLYNDWEGCLFSFNETKLMSLARKAKKLGCELFVLDDGWFGARNTDTAGLGDYSVNRSKLPNGLEGLSRKIHALGMDFGLWFEPEAVNPDSDLYRAHPDWALTSPGCRDLYGRNEMLLDLTRAEVRDYIVESVSGILDQSDIQYVKWDMNRHSLALGEKAYDYILGLYDVLRRIFEPRPQILLEGCASGGNRFDLGMLCFAPQIWASDDTDPIERLDIQTGLSYLYPQSTIGAHISEAPHAQTLRMTPMSTRANVAFFGAFGIELDLAHLTPVEEAEIREAVAFYKEHRSTFQFGMFRRNRTEENAVCWQATGENDSVVGLFHRLIPAGPGYEWLYAGGLEPETVYSVENRLQALHVGQFGGLVKHIAPVEINPNGSILRAADRYYRMNDATEKMNCTGTALDAGVAVSQRYAGTGYREDLRVQGDFLSNLYLITRR